MRKTNRLVPTRDCGCCKTEPPPPPCPLPAVTCELVDIAGTWCIDWNITFDPGYPVTRAWILENCDGQRIIPLTVPPYSGQYCDPSFSPVCEYWVYAENDCGIAVSYCKPPVTCPDCTPCTPAGCTITSGNTECPIECCDPLSITIQLSASCNGGATIVVNPDPMRPSPCSETFTNVYNDGVTQIDVTMEWDCDETGNIIFRVIVYETDLGSGQQRCVSTYEEIVTSCKCPRVLQGDRTIPRVDVTGTCTCLDGITTISAIFPSIPEGCCETFYDEETCEFCWECNGVDRVDLISPTLQVDIGDSGRIFIGDTAEYCIRSYYKNCEETYCHQNADPCCADVECDCYICEEGADPAGACTCFDSMSKTCQPMPQIEVTVAGVVQGANACLNCNDFNGTFVTAPNTPGTACNNLLYADVDPVNDCEHTLEVDYPFLERDDQGVWKCWVRVRMYSKVGPDFIEENQRCDWFEFPAQPKDFDKWTNPSCPGMPATFRCYECMDISGSSPPFHSRQCDSPASPCVPGHVQCDQHPDPCQFQDATVTVRFL